MLPMTAPNNTTTAATITEIAAGVTRGAAMQLAEQSLSRLRRHRDVLQAEMAELARVYRDGEDQGRPTSRAEIDALTVKIREVESEIASLRPTVSVMRAARAQRVEAALSSIRRDSAKAALGAIAQLQVATGVLTEVATAIRAAGDADQQTVPIAPVGSLEMYLQRIIKT